MKTISISNQKGGCGKTTTAINLAGALANLGKKVLVIDLDPQSHASFGLGVTSQSQESSIYNVLTDNPEKRRAIEDCIVNVSQNLDLVPSNILLSTLEQELKDKEDAVSKLHCALQNSQSNYNYAVVDCPPSLGFLTFNALRAADLVIVPIDMSAFSLMGIGKLLGMLELIKVKINHAPSVKALATIFDRRTKYSQTMLDEIKNFFKEQMLETVIRTSVALKKAAFAGVPVIQLDDRANGALDHIALAKEVLTAEDSAVFEKALAEVSEVSDGAFAVVSQGAAEVIVPQIRQGVAVGAQDSPARIPDEKIQASAQPDSFQETSKTPNIDAAIKELTFFIDMPNAKNVHLVGDFNQWKIDDASRLLKSENGRWAKSIAVLPGKYRYKFVVDGEWVLDSQNSEKEQNPFGTFDSVIKL